MTRKLLIFLTLVVIAFFAAAATQHAYAGEASIKTRPNDKRTYSETSDEEPLTKEEIRKMALKYARESLEDVTYHSPTIQNLSRLYWALGIHDYDDFDAINNFLLINECAIYNEYYHDDFEWRKIVEATRDHLKASKSEFPVRFYFTREIELGRYNFKTEAFYVVTEDLRHGSRRHEMEMYSVLEEVCGFRGLIPGYPRNVNVILSRPFRLQYVPVSEDMAQDFVVRTRYKNRSETQDLPPEAAIVNYERKVYLRIRVRFIKFLEFERKASGYPAASLFAVLEGYDVFEDKEGKKILFTTGN